MEAEFEPGKCYLLAVSLDNRIYLIVDCGFSKLSADVLVKIFKFVCQFVVRFN